mgnify:CR=1 FL=1
MPTHFSTEGTPAGIANPSAPAPDDFTYASWQQVAALA